MSDREKDPFACKQVGCVNKNTDSEYIAVTNILLDQVIHLPIVVYYRFSKTRSRENRKKHIRESISSCHVSMNFSSVRWF